MRIEPCGAHKARHLPDWKDATGHCPAITDHNFKPTPAPYEHWCDVSVEKSDEYDKLRADAIEAHDDGASGFMASPDTVIRLFGKLDSLGGKS